MSIISYADVYAQKVGDTDHGRVGVNEPIYWIDKYEQTLVDISGECYDSSGQRTKIKISITYPDSTTKIHEIISTEKCKFVLSIILDSSAPFGRHQVSAAVVGGNSLGDAYFQTMAKSSLNDGKQDFIPNSITTNTAKIVVMTDMESYMLGSPIRVYGNVSPTTHNKIPLTLVITDSSNSIVAIDQFETDLNDEFSRNIKTDGTLWDQGEYTVKISHQEMYMYTETNFSLMPKIYYTFTIEMDLIQNSQLFDFSLSKFQMQDNMMRFENSNEQTVHVYGAGYDIEYLFDSLGLLIDDDCIVSADGTNFCTDSDYNLQFKINGKDVTQLHNYVPSKDDQIKIIFKSIPQSNTASSSGSQSNTASSSGSQSNTASSSGSQSNTASSSGSQSNTAPLTSNPGSSPSNPLTTATQSQNELWLVLVLLAVIVIFGIIMAKKRGNISVQTIKNIQSKSGNTIQFYECPKCHNPDIQNKSDGSVYCGKCGFGI